MSLKGLFVKESTIPASIAMKPQTVSVAPITAPAAQSDETMRMLEAVLEENQTAGFDYPKFRKSLEQLKTTLPDERTRMQSALAMIKAVGVSPTSLIASAMNCVEMINKEKGHFEQEMEDTMTREVTNPRARIAGFEEDIKKKTEELAALQKEKESITAGARESENKIAALRSNFTISHQVMVKGIQDDVEKIKLYTGGR